MTHLVGREAEHDRNDDARSLLRARYTNEADLTPDHDARTLAVRLHHLANHSSDDAIRYICRELTATETIFPNLTALESGRSMRRQSRLQREGARLVPGGEALLLVPILYLMAIAGLAVFGAHRYFLLALYLNHRRKEQPFEGRSDSPLPRVTVQLPIYNERHVVERLVRAAAALDYPAELLEIQVLDDSTDDTSAIVSSVIHELRGSGIEIVHIRRADRVGFKAGALAEGTRRASGELLAIFDADFLSHPPRPRGHGWRTPKRRPVG